MELVGPASVPVTPDTYITNEGGWDPPLAAYKAYVLLFVDLSLVTIVLALPLVAVGYTQASIVILLVRSSWALMRVDSTPTRIQTLARAARAAVRQCREERRSCGIVSLGQI
jgi:hypothetical protein